MNAVSSSFSAESKEMMAVSRDIAISLGYDRISTLHFFLAGCSLDGAYSLKDFAFENEEAYQEFYEKCRREKPAPFSNSPVPLTSEAEKALRTAVQFWFRRYHDDEIKSYHILLAAGGHSGSSLASRLKIKGNLHRRIEQYYIEKGIIHEHNIKRNFWEKFLRR